MERNAYGRMPEGMRDYIDEYGWNFNKKLANFAVSKMKNKTGKHFTADEVAVIVEKNGLKVAPEDKYNVQYLYNYFYSDHYPRTTKSEQDIVSAINDHLEDEDGYEGMALVRYDADRRAKGRPLYWEEFI